MRGAGSRPAGEEISYAARRQADSKNLILRMNNAPFNSNVICLASKLTHELNAARVIERGAREADQVRAPSPR